MKVNSVEQFADLYKRIEKGEISAKDAEAEILVITKEYQSWKTPYWKERRDLLIGDHCVKCGATSEETIMVLQHLWHPPSIHDIRGKFYQEYKEVTPFKKEITQEINESIRSLPRETRDACPECNSKNVRFRKRDELFVCNRCKIEFKEPKQVDDYRKQDDRKNKLWQDVGKKRWAEFKNNDEWQRRVLLEWIPYSYRYLSLHDTNTFCRKCAAKWDFSSTDICPVCVDRYKKIDKPVCYECQYNEEEGIYILTLESALKWISYRDLFPERCVDNFQHDAILFFACLLDSDDIELISLHDNYIITRSTQPDVYASISARYK